MDEFLVINRDVELYENISIGLYGLYDVGIVISYIYIYFKIRSQYAQIRE
jgi:hypothetical protein